MSPATIEECSMACKGCVECVTIDACVQLLRTIDRLYPDLLDQALYAEFSNLRDDTYAIMRSIDAGLDPEHVELFETVQRRIVERSRVY